MANVRAVSRGVAAALLRTGMALRRRAFLDFGDYKKTVFLAGGARSGTTWLEEVINWNHTHRVIFEPFNPRKVPLVAEWHMRQYLAPSEPAPCYYRGARKILSGHVRNRWADMFNNVTFVRRRLIKDVRANLFLKWLKNRFPELHIVFILRHPCAVALSRERLGWGAGIHGLGAQPRLIADILQPLGVELEQQEDSFLSHVLSWCVENFVPLASLEPGDAHVVFYEDMCVAPEQTLRSLFGYLGYPGWDDALRVVGTPSALSSSGSPVKTGDDLVESWIGRVSAARREKSIGILTRFGLDHVYGEGPTPLMRSEDLLASFALPSAGEPGDAAGRSAVATRVAGG